MDKAKAAISDFLSKDGKHRTSVDQDHAPAVTEEHIHPHRHEEATTVVDREVHKDHHYTTVQPITTTETVPEQHHHNTVPVEHKTVDHGGAPEMGALLEKDSAKFTNTSTTHETTHSTSTVPVVTGEHVHHHVHEHIQPVIQKETIQPHVIHTTIPIHETHHAAPVHHGTKIAPVKTLEEFTAAGGPIEGKSVKDLHEFDGCPTTETSSSHDMNQKTATASRGVGVQSHTSSKTEPASGLSTAADGRDSTVFDTSTTSTGEDVSRIADTIGTSGVRSRDNATTTLDSSAPGTDQGSMFGKDKVANIDDQSANTTSSHSKSVESRSFLKKKNHPDTKDRDHGSADNYQISSAIDTGATGTTGAIDSKVGKSETIPRSELSQSQNISDSGATAGMEPWRAGETHQTNIAETVHDTGVKHRATLVDKLNPFKDADGDGKKGFMK